MGRADYLYEGGVRILDEFIQTNFGTVCTCCIELFREKLSVKVARDDSRSYVNDADESNFGSLF